MPKVKYSRKPRKDQAIDKRVKEFMKQFPLFDWMFEKED